MKHRKEATSFTTAANSALLSELNWDDVRDFEAASRGFIASLDDPVILTADGRPAWDLSAYPFLEEETAPSSVNPSLWRQSRLVALLPRPVQGHRRRLPDPRLRSVGDEYHRNRQRLCGY